jgi:hypothetical protein
MALYKTFNIQRFGTHRQHLYVTVRCVIKKNELFASSIKHHHMKKITLSIALLFISAITSFTYAQGVGVGIKAGVNFANQSISDISTSSRTGFLAGVYVPIYFSETWGIVPEVLFSSIGSETPNNVNDFTYLSIPVMLRFKPASFLSIEAGPQFSSLLDAVDEDGDSFKEDVKGSDFGLGVGATVHLPLGLNAGARYVWGFTNVADLEGDFEVKNTTFQLFAGWTILGAK